MTSLQKIHTSPYYFGEIPLTEVKNILQNEPPKSYLFRRLENGVITLATTYDYFKTKKLLEMELKSCNCTQLSIPIQDLKSFREGCQNLDLMVNFGLGIEKFQPVVRKNPLSLKEIAKNFVSNSCETAIDDLELPKSLKKDLKDLKQHENDQSHTRFAHKFGCFLGYHHSYNDGLVHVSKVTKYYPDFI